MRKAVLGLLLTALFLVTLVPSALAVDRREGSRLTVEAGETVEDDLLLSAVAVTIDGTVKGDVIAFAQSVTVNGTIEGNLVAMTGSVDVRGRVGGTVYTAAEDLLVTGDVGNSVVSFTSTAVIDQSAVIGGNWIGFGDRLRSEGLIGRGVIAGASTLLLNGPVAKDVEAWIGQLTLGSKAAIDGTVTYHSEREAVLGSGARACGLQFVPERYQTNFDFNSGRFKAIGMAVQFAGFLIVGLIVLALFPRLRFSFHRAVVEKPWQTPLVGLLILLAVPLAAILVMITVVGIPLGLVSLLVYPLAIYLGQVLLSWTVGRLIADRWAWLGGQQWAILFLSGAVVTTLLTEIPVISFAFSLLAVLYGLGGLFFAYTNKGVDQGAA